MNDTRPSSARRLAELFAAKSGADRLAMGCAMFDDAKTMALAGLRAQNPGLGARELRRELLLRFYRSDFGPERLSRVLKRLA